MVGEIKTEQEVFDSVIARLKEIEPIDDMDKLAEVLEGLSPDNFPEGEVKDFFREVETIFDPIDELAKEKREKTDIAGMTQDINKLIEILRATKAKFETAECPDSVPREIVVAYVKFLDSFLALVNLAGGVLAFENFFQFSLD